MREYDEGLLDDESDDTFSGNLSPPGEYHNVFDDPKLLAKADRSLVGFGRWMRQREALKQKVKDAEYSKLLASVQVYLKSNDTATQAKALADMQTTVADDHELSARAKALARIKESLGKLHSIGNYDGLGAVPLLKKLLTSAPFEVRKELIEKIYPGMTLGVQQENCDGVGRGCFRHCHDVEQIMGYSYAVSLGCNQDSQKPDDSALCHASNVILNCGGVHVRVESMQTALGQLLCKQCTLAVTAYVT
jgi:hypothetical protein